MIASSRPLRFLVLLLSAWVAMRTVQLWPVSSPIPALLRTFVPPLEAAPARDYATPDDSDLSHIAAIAGRRRVFPAAVAVSRTGGSNRRGRDAPFAFALLPSIAAGAASPTELPIGSPLPAPDPVDRVPSRLRASAWAIVRGGGAASPFAPQLGGSQTGVRLTYPLDDARRLSLAARLSTALGSRQREAAIGVDWQPTPLPVHLIAEQRIGIAGVRGGPSVGMIAGVGPLPIIGGFRLEAYGQAGGVARDRRVEGYADGAARLTRPIVTVGATAIDLGLGGWGGAQRGAARLDVGPTASAALRVGDKTIRFSFDWRQRVAGRAQPGSGPALSIGTDF